MYLILIDLLRLSFVEHLVLMDQLGFPLLYTIHASFPIPMHLTHMETFSIIHVKVSAINVLRVRCPKMTL